MSEEKDTSRKHREYEHQHNLYKTREVKYGKKSWSFDPGKYSLLHWFLFGLGAGAVNILFDLFK